VTTPDVERRLTDALHRHAEDAMRRTDTSAELDRFHERVGEASGTNARFGLVAAAAAMTAAAVMAVLVWSTGPAQDEESLPADSRAAQTADERVGQDLADAFFAGDTDRVRDRLAAGTSVRGSLPSNLGWRDHLRLREALSADHDVQTCQETGTSPSGTTVACPFDYHSFRSEELGLAPFGNNILSMVVTDGEVRGLQVSYNTENNGEAELYKDIGAWVREEHPGEWAFMDQWVPEDTARWVRLWKLRTAQYADEMNRS
jgi:hypothetical protein